MALIKIDLTELLGEGQYVEIRDPRLIPWGEQRKLQQNLKDQSVDSQYEFTEDLALSLVKNGNVVDESGEVIAFPWTKEVLATRVPSVVIEEIGLKFAEIRKAAKVEKKS